MNQNLRSPLIRAVLLTLIFPTCATADDASLQEIAEGLQQWSSSWVTIRFEYTSANHVQLRRYSGDPAIQNAESLDGYHFWNEIILTDSGNRRWALHRVKAGVKSAGMVHVHNATKSVWAEEQYHLREDGTRHLASLSLSTWNPSFGVAGAQTGVVYEPWVRRPLVPMWNAATSEWLGDTLARAGNVKLSYEDLDGVRCARIELGDYVLWLDSTHGWLPRRLEPQGETVGDVWSVNEFSQLENGIWFPRRGTVWFTEDPEDEVVSWVVTDVAVNEAIPAGVFDPAKPQIGTKVNDDRTGRHYTHGVDVSSTGDAAGRPVEHGQEQARRVTATIPFVERYGGPLALLVIASLVLMTGIWLSRRQ